MKEKLRLLILLCFLTTTTAPAQFSEGSLMIQTGDTLSISQTIKEARSFKYQFPDSARQVLQAMLAKSKQLHYQTGIIHALYQIGFIDLRSGDYEGAVAHFFASLQHCDPKRHRQVMAELYNNIGNAYNNLYRFESAYQAYDKAIELVKDDPYLLASVYNNSATVLGQLKQYEKALSYINRGLLEIRQMGREDLMATLLLNKARCYIEMKRYESTQRYIDSAVALAKKYHKNDELLAGLIEYAQFYLATDRPREALMKLLEAADLSNRPDIQKSKQDEFLGLVGQAYFDLKNYKEAEKYLLLALENAGRQSKSQALAIEKLAELYAATGAYEKAYAFQQRYLGLRDTFQSTEIALRVNEMETRYRTAEKDKEIAQSRLQISNQQKRIAEKNSWIFGIVSLAMLTILLLLSRFFYVRQKNRKLQSEQEISYLKAAMEGEQKERVRIANELHDGIVSELAAIKLNLEGFEYPDAERRQYYQLTLSQLDRTIHDVRNTAHNLMPEMLLRYNLPDAVRSHCLSIQKTGRLDIDFQESGDFTHIDMALRHAIYRIIQELLHNIIKHARASKAFVQLGCYEDVLSVTLEDDSIGTDWKTIDRGMGITSIENRVRTNKGIIHWADSAEGGTNVYIEFKV